MKHFIIFLFIIGFPVRLFAIPTLLECEKAGWSSEKNRIKELRDLIPVYQEYALSLKDKNRENFTASDKSKLKVMHEIEMQFFQQYHREVLSPKIKYLVDEWKEREQGDLESIYGLIYQAIKKALTGFDVNRPIQFTTYFHFVVHSVLQNERHISKKLAFNNSFTPLSSLNLEAETKELGVKNPDVLPIDLMNEFEKIANMAGLSSKERTIIILYYIDGLTATEIGQGMNLARARIQQIIKKTLRTLRSSANIYRTLNNL